MANRHVFPGGVREKEDGGPQWEQLLGKDFHRRIQTPELEEHISHRVCGIREVFEETGLLLAHPLENASEANVTASSYVTPPVPGAFRKLRKEVHNDPTSFFTMCSKMSVAPCINQLYPWSNWYGICMLLLTAVTTFYFNSPVTHQTMLNSKLSPSLFPSHFHALPGSHLL